MIYEVSKQLPFELEWWGYIRLDLLRAHPETIDWLFESGLRSALFGIETLHPPTAKIIGKGGSREGLFSVLKQIKTKYGKQVNLHGTFIFGLPEEPFESMQETAEFLLSDKNPLDSWAIQPLNIKPSNKNYSNDFLSDIDKNYSKYGYENLGEAHSAGKGMYTAVKYPTGQMVWKNKFVDYLQVEEYSVKVRELEVQKNKAKMTGSSSFGFATNEIGLHDTLNVLHSEVNWHLLDKNKLKRSIM